MTASGSADAERHTGTTMAARYGITVSSASVAICTPSMLGVSATRGYSVDQTLSTASSSGALTQTAETVLPAWIPVSQEASSSSEGLSPSSIAILPLFNQLIRNASTQEPNYECRLFCSR